MSCWLSYAECPEQSWDKHCQDFCGLIPTGPSHAENLCTHDIVCFCGLIVYDIWPVSAEMPGERDMWTRVGWPKRGVESTQHCPHSADKIGATSSTICLREIPPSLLWLWPEQQEQDMKWPQRYTQGGGSNGRTCANKVNTPGKHRKEATFKLQLKVSLFWFPNFLRCILLLQVKGTAVQVVALLKFWIGLQTSLIVTPQNGICRTL